MGFFDNIIKSAQDAAGNVSKTVSKAAADVSKTASKVKADASKSISAGVKSVSETATVVGSRIQSGFGSMSDSVSELADKKIREMLKGVDLKGTIVSLKDYQKKTGKDVSPLTNFLIQLDGFISGEKNNPQNKK